MLFDFDGLLADTEALHHDTFVRTLEDEGLRLPEGIGIEDFLGVHDRACFAHAYELAGRSLDRDELERLVELKGRRFTAGLESVPLFPGARRLIEEARRRAAITIVSGGRREEIHIVLSRHHLIDHFPWMVTSDDVERPKPDPDCFLRALQGFRERGLDDLEPGECLVFEDSVNGVDAAIAAGMRCVAVTNSFPAKRLAAADHVLDSLEAWRWEDATW